MDIQAIALRDVMAERLRQISVEGWTPAHDDEHDHGQLIDAACVYAEYAADDGSHRGALRRREKCRPPSGWPWDAEWYKPQSRRRDLVRAAALIVAEVERLDRAEAASVDSTPDHCWSANKEDWQHESLGDLLDCEEGLKVGDVVYVGDKLHVRPSMFVSADTVIDEMGDRACDFAGDYASDFPDLGDGARQALQSLLEAWSEHYCAAPTFYQVTDVMPYTIAEGDMADRGEEE